MNMTQATGAVCQIKLENGDDCGITALGRCATCGRAFCRSHQAYALNPSLCTPCGANIFVPRNYFSDGSARSDLLTSGVQSVDLYKIQRQREPKKGFFDRGERWVDMLISVGRGWILGEFWWKYRIPDPDYNRYVEENWLTALLDEPHDDEVAQSILYWQNAGLFPVQPCSGGYTLIMKDNAYLSDTSPPGGPNWKIGTVTVYDSGSYDPWKAAAQAVKRLTGVSS